jgi:hypothetical protein
MMLMKRGNYSFVHVTDPDTLLITCFILSKRGKIYLSPFVDLEFVRTVKDFAVHKKEDRLIVNFGCQVLEFSRIKGEVLKELKNRVAVVLFNINRQIIASRTLIDEIVGLDICNMQEYSVHASPEALSSLFCYVKSEINGEIFISTEIDMRTEEGLSVIAGHVANGEIGNLVELGCLTKVEKYSLCKRLCAKRDEAMEATTILQNIVKAIAKI